MSDQTTQKKRKRAKDWGAMFRKLQMAAYERETLKGRQEFIDKQVLKEKTTDIGEDNEDYVEYMLRKEDTIAIAGLTNQLPSRTASLPWLLKVRNIAIHCIVYAGGNFGFRQITAYTAVIYVDRFLSSVPKNPKFPIPKILGVTCLYMACKIRLSADEDSPEYRKSMLNMRDRIVEQFGGILTFVTPIHFIKYFLSKFCKDVERTESARSKAVEIIMSTLGDVRLMSLRAFSVGAAATLLASNPKILTNEVIKDELINALPQKWIIPLDEVCCCYNLLLETNRHRLDIS